METPRGVPLGGVVEMASAMTGVNSQASYMTYTGKTVEERGTAYFVKVGRKT